MGLLNFLTWNNTRITKNELRKQSDLIERQNRRDRQYALAGQVEEGKIQSFQQEVEKLKKELGMEGDDGTRQHRQQD